MEGLWPILIIWIIAVLFGGKKKKPPAGARTGASFQSDLQRALDELKRAEADAQPSREPRPSAGTERAREYLEDRKRGGSIQPGRRLEVFTPGPRPDRVVRRPVRPLEDDDWDKSSETVPAEPVVEIRDYDEEAEDVIASRLAAARDHAGSIMDMSAAQRARRAGRPARAIGGAEEHAEWHEQLGVAGRPGSGSPPPSRLGRYADGTARSAVILAELLGPPPGLR